MVDSWCIRKRSVGYHRLLVIANNRMIFKSKDLAETFLELYRYPKDIYYPDKYTAFEFEKLLDSTDVNYRDWKPYMPERRLDYATRARAV